MGQMNTAGYDVAFVVSDVEMTRMVSTLFLERPPAHGLPLEFEMPIHLEEPNGNGGVSALDGFFIAQFDLPTVSFDPSRQTVDENDEPLTEHPANSIEIRLPFSQSTLKLDSANPIEGIFNLKGATSFVIPFGYLLDDNDESVFGLDVENASVWLTIADDDPDPGWFNQTSLEKIVTAFAWRERTWDANTQREVEAQMAIQLRSAPMMTDLSSGLLKLKAGACNPADRRPVPLVPRLEAPSEILCMDFETFRAEETDLSYIALKFKLAPETINVGSDTAALGHSWLGDGGRASILISNDFLLNHLLPPEIVKALIKDEHERRRFVEEKDLVEEFFRAPLSVRSPIPMRLVDLPLADEDSEDANTFIEDVTLAVVSDPDNDDDMVQATLAVRGGAPLYAFPDAYAAYYTFDATILINIRFDTRGGQIRIETETDDASAIDVDVTPFADVVVDRVIQYVLKQSNGFLPLELAVVALGLFLADLLAGFLAHDPALDAVDERLPEVSVDTDSLEEIPSVLFSSARLDDLILRGRLEPSESASVSYDGTSLQASATVRLNLEAERDELSPLVGDDPLARDAFTGVDDETASVVCEGTRIRALHGTSLHYFGPRKLWQAMNITQADLREVAYDTEEIEFEDDDSEPTEIDQFDFAAARESPILAFGVKTALGRFALLVLWKPAIDRLSCYYRRYKQTLPRVDLVQHVAESTDCSGGTLTGTYIPVPGSAADAVSGSDFSGTMSVFVGYQIFDCVTRGKFEARPIVLRWPLEFIWTVITNDGVRHPVSAEPTLIDVTVTPTVPPTIGGFQVTSSDSSVVTFTLSGAGNRFCSFETQRGLNGMFMIEVRVVERAEATFEPPPGTIKFLGKYSQRVGFDKVKRLLDQLRRGAEDPARWLNAVPTAPVIGPDPTVEAPDLRDQPVLENWLVPGVADPPDRAPLLTREIGQRWDRRYFKSGSSRVERDAARPGEEISKEALLDSTRQSFLELPEHLRAEAPVKLYMANILKLVSSLPDPPDLGDPRRREPPVNDRRGCLFGRWFAGLFGFISSR